MRSPMPFTQPIYVTEPLLPDLQDVMKMLGKVFDSKQLTNNGAMARQLERQLAGFLGVESLSLFTNGTVALQIACKALGLTGEVITTPFTFAATPHALSWNNIRPVFCDIDDDTLNIDTGRIEELIGPETTGILPVHVFGNPCRVDKLAEIAARHGLKLVYDAAHAFGVEIGGKPVGTFGDISMFSLHATKIYHTIEGGALTFREPAMKAAAELLKNFGIRDEDSITVQGTNGKMNEVQAVFGILLLDLVQDEIDKRKAVTRLYRKLLQDIPGIRLSCDMQGVRHNYPYFVIRVKRDLYGISRDELQQELREYNIFSRRYFYPACNQFECYSGLSQASACPAAARAASEVLALPMHGRLPYDDVERICDAVRVLGKR